MRRAYRLYGAAVWDLLAHCWTPEATVDSETAEMPPLFSSVLPLSLSQAPAISLAC